MRSRPQPNGVGPWWAPACVRRALTWLSSWFFSEASWEHHDIGYARGRPSRAKCDRRFLAAMLRDASRAGPVWRMVAACTLAWIFWTAVRLGGWISYNWHPKETDNDGATR